jgi:hypothetical protein
MICALERGQEKWQVGDDTEVASVKNAVTAHLLAENELLEAKFAGRENFVGEAFFISIGIPMSFRKVCRKVSKAADVNAQLDDVKVIPTWLLARVYHFTAIHLLVLYRLASGSEGYFHGHFKFAHCRRMFR